MLGFELTKQGTDLLLIWLAVLFISILVHELGHALVARAFGYAPRILLHQFGGLAMFEPGRNFSRTQSVLVSLAGPFAGFVLYGLSILVAQGISPENGGLSFRLVQC